MLEAAAEVVAARATAASADRRVEKCTRREVYRRAGWGAETGAGRTLTSPCIITPCTVQKYVNVPTLLNVCVKVNGGL